MTALEHYLRLNSRDNHKEKNPDKHCGHIFLCDALVDSSQPPADQHAGKSPESAAPYDLKLTLSDPSFQINEKNAQKKTNQNTIIGGNLKWREKISYSRYYSNNK